MAPPTPIIFPFALERFSIDCQKRLRLWFGSELLRNVMSLRTKISPFIWNLITSKVEQAATCSPALSLARMDLLSLLPLWLARPTHFCGLKTLDWKLLQCYTVAPHRKGWVNRQSLKHILKLDFAKKEKAVSSSLFVHSPKAKATVVSGANQAIVTQPRDTRYHTLRMCTWKTTNERCKNKR